MLTAAGAQAGVVGGLPCLLGVATGMGVMMFVVPLGLGSLVLERPLSLKALHWGGAAVLLWLSWKIATSGGHVDSPPDRRATVDGRGRQGSTVDGRGRQGSTVGYLGAAIFQWINPKSWLVTASAAGTFLSADAGSPVAQAASLGALFALAALPSGFLWLAFGAALQHVLHPRRRLRIFNIAMGILLALSIVLIIR